MELHMTRGLSLILPKTSYGDGAYHLHIVEMSKRKYCFCFTLNNPTPEETAALDAYDFKYLAYGREHWDDPTKTPHFQGMFQLKEAKTMSAMIKDATSKISGRGAVIMSVVKVLDQAVAYCFKGDQTHEEWEQFQQSGPNYGLNAVVVEKGVRPITDRKEDGKERAKRNLDALLEHRPEDVDIDIVATNLKNLQYGAAFLKQARNTPEDLEQDPTEYCEFHYGVSRAGKSEYTRFLGSKPFLWFPKTQWNRYDFEDIVVFCDIDSSACPTPNELKTWTDPAPFLADIKYGTMHIRPKRMIVTTNEKSMARLYRRYDDEIVEPLVERFEFYEWTEKYFIDGKKKLGPNPLWHLPDGLVLDSPVDESGPIGTEYPDA